MMKDRISKKNLVSAQGFTVIEVVITVLILGIVSAFAMTRILEGNSYDSAIVSDQLISLARSAQQKALGRNDVNLRVQPNGNELEIVVSDGSGVVESVSLRTSGVSLYSDVNQLNACNTTPSGTLITEVAPLVLSYNSLGNLLDGGVGASVDIESGARICLTPDTNLSICISAAGFAYRGACLD